jgi:hypothetical protein
METGGLFHIPDSFPIPSRDELRALLDESLRADTGVPHLAEWKKIVGARNSAKNEIERFGRIERLARYWALMHDRHLKALAGQKGRLHQAFAKFFDTSEDTIRRDLRRIEASLGKCWLDRFRLHCH